jgi:hypothetical protein
MGEQPSLPFCHRGHHPIAFRPLDAPPFHSEERLPCCGQFHDHPVLRIDSVRSRQDAKCDGSIGESSRMPFSFRRNSQDVSDHICALSDVEQCARVGGSVVPRKQCGEDRGRDHYLGASSRIFSEGTSLVAVARRSPGYFWGMEARARCRVFVESNEHGQDRCGRLRGILQRRNNFPAFERHCPQFWNYLSKEGAGLTFCPGENSAHQVPVDSLVSNRSHIEAIPRNSR